MSDPNLITPYTFHGHPYLIKMHSTNCCLEIILTDKQSGEEWECSYDISYIENLTRKTGNFKQFEIFTMMLKSGLLKTSDCITLDLLTYENLESLRVRRLRNHSSSRLFGSNNNRRYLIVTYTVEFDKINYPLPLEYCGPPDPEILQATVRKLESELSKAHEKLELKNNSNERQLIRSLEKRIDELMAENSELKEDVRRLSRIVDKKPKSQVQTLQRAIDQLEKNVKYERNSHHKLVAKLQSDKVHLANQLEKLKNSEKSLKAKLQTLTPRLHMHDIRAKSLPVPKLHEQTMHLRRRSPSVKIVSERAATQRSRSASPRITHTSNWQSFPNNLRRPITRSKSRSRSSSISSTKQSERQFVLDVPLNTEAASIDSKYIRKKSYLSSGSVETLSNSSETNRGKSKKFATSLPNSRSTTANVKKLETQVRKLFYNRHF